MTPPPPARRSHTKSRLGCTNCKKRKVKCDEQPPSCFNCTRRGVPCSLAASQQSHGNVVDRSLESSSTGAGTTADLRDEFDSLGPPRSTETPLTPSTSFGLRAPEQTPINRTPVPDPDPHGAHTYGPSPTASWARSLELMHHWTTVTSKTVALRPDMQHVWSVIVPQIAYDHPFLMHGLIAAAAMHKAYLLPGQRDTYHDIAAYHQMVGLEGFRKSKSLISDENWKAHFCFSSLLALVVCCQPARVNPAFRLNNDVPDILELFVFVRGLNESLFGYQSKITFTQLSPLVHGVWIVTPADPSYRFPPMQQSPLPDDVFDALRSLRGFYDTTTAGARREGYIAAVSELEQAAYLMAHAGPQPEIGMLLFVPYVLRDVVMNDIEAVDPDALVFLSYFCVFSAVMERLFWFMRGWSRRLFDTIDGRLIGRPLSLRMVQWPRRHVFSG